MTRRKFLQLVGIGGIVSLTGLPAIANTLEVNNKSEYFIISLMNHKVLGK